MSGGSVDLKSIFDSVPGCFLVLAPDPPKFTILAATDDYLKVTQTRRETIIGTGFFEIFPNNPAHPPTPAIDLVRASLARVLEHRRPYIMDTHRHDIRLPQGGWEVRHWDVANFPVLSPDGEVSYIIHRVHDVTDAVRSQQTADQQQAVNLDLRNARAAALNLMEDAVAARRQIEEANENLRQEIAERQRAEAALRQERDFSDAVLETAGALVVVVDAGGRITRLNQVALALAGYPAGEVIGRVFWELLLPPEDLPAAKALWRTLNAEDFPNTRENYWISRNGQRHLISWYNTAIVDPQGRVQHIIATGIDITEHQKVQEALRESEERFHGMFERHHAVMLLIEPVSGAIVDANAAASRFYGYTREQLCALRIQDINQLSPEEVTADRELAATEDRNHFVFPHRLHSGEIRWVEVYSTPVETRGRSLLYSIIHDITERQCTEEALRQSELFFRQTLESIPGMVFTTRPDGYCDYQSQQWVDFTGVPVSQHLGDGWNTLLHPEDQPIALAAWRNAVAGRGPYDVDYRIRRHDGEYEWFTVRGRPIRDGNGEIVRWFGVATSIQALKRSTEELRQSQERYHELFNTLIEGFCMIEVLFDAQDRPVDYRFLEINPSFESQTGLHDALGRRILELAPGHETYWFDIFGEVARTGRPTRFVNEAKALNRWYDVSAYRVGGPGSHNVGILFNDITARKRREEDLRQSEQQYRLLFAANASPMFVFDAETLAFLAVNDAAVRHYGWSSEEFLNMTVLDIRRPEDQDAAREIISKQSTSGSSISGIRHCRKDGTLMDMEITTSSISFAGRPGRLCSMNDVTERKRAAEALAAAKNSAEQAMRAAEAANKAKDDFLAVLSHELRNPLNPVLATATMLHKDPRFDADTRQQLEVICRNAELEARLIDDLLDVTRIERGKIELTRQHVELRNIIRHAAEVCMPDINARGLEFGINMPEGSFVVDADPARLQQVLWNLISNSVKFTPVGGCVGIFCRREEDNVIVQITDSGEGIDPDLLPRLFKAFEQGGRKMTRQFGGLGLGLAISRNIVQLHGGTLTAHSDGKGKGATFTVRLPLLPAQTPLTPSDNSSLPAAIPLLASLRILLVEDHGDTAQIMSRLLRSQGHHIHLAADVATALKLAAENPFDLLLSDLGLPDGSGLDLMRALRAQGLQIPGIALSGFGQEQDLRQSREAGFTTHLVKPVNILRLQDAIANIMNSPS